MIEFFKGLFGAKQEEAKQHEEDYDEPDARVVGAPPALPMKGERRPSAAPPPMASPPSPPPPPPPPPKPKRVRERIPDAGPIEVDFVAVLDEASVGEVDRDRITRAQSLLRTLPDEAPVELKRRIVEAAFANFDVPTSKIVEASTAAVAALDGYVKTTKEQTARTIAASEQRIAELEASIRAERAAIERANDVQAQREKLATHESQGIQPIIGFFASAAKAPPTPPSARSLPPKPPQVVMAPLEDAVLEDRSSVPPLDDEVTQA